MSCFFTQHLHPFFNFFPHMMQKLAVWDILVFPQLVHFT
nr:MAG TPA: hypothetical protein [Caudoviricetes sp.]